MRRTDRSQSQRISSMTVVVDSAPALTIRDPKILSDVGYRVKISERNTDTALETSKTNTSPVLSLIWGVLRDFLSQLPPGKRIQTPLPLKTRILETLV